MFASLKIIVPALIIFIAIDLLWLGVVAKGLYGSYLGNMMRVRLEWPHVIAALLTWLCLVLGIYFFVLPKVAMSVEPIWAAIIIGGLFGLLTYAVYDLTNYATLKNWPFALVVLDMCWGMTVCSINTVIMWQLSRWMS